MNQDTQQHIVTLLSQPVAVLVAVAWLMGIVIWLTWWVTNHVNKFVSWTGLSKAIEKVQEALLKALKEHKDEDIRMFDETANRYQKGMEMATQKFKEGMDLTGKYLQQVTAEQQTIRQKAEATTNDLHEIKGALRALLPEEQANKIFKEAS